MQQIAQVTVFLGYGDLKDTTRMRSELMAKKTNTPRDMAF